MYDYETRRMCQAIEREIDLARAHRLARLGYQPDRTRLNLLAPVRRLTALVMLVHRRRPVAGAQLSSSDRAAT